MNPEHLIFLSRDRQRALLSEAEHLHLLRRAPARAGLRVWVAHILRHWADFLEPQAVFSYKPLEPCPSRAVGE